MSIIIFIICFAFVLDFMFGGGTPLWLAVISAIACAVTFQSVSFAIR